jgi:iron complex outermembrane receptor protein
VGVNYYDIKWKDIVSAPSFQGIVDSGDPTRVLRDPITNNIVTVFNNFINISDTRTKGVDLEMRYRINSDFGRWTPRLNFTYVDTWFQDGVEYAGTNGQGTSTIPRVKGFVAVDWDYRALSMTGQMNYTRRYLQQFLVGSFFVPGDPRFQHQAYPEKVPSYITYDLYASYDITKNLKISASVLNLTNKLPFYDPGFDSTNNYDVSLFDVRGTQYRLGFTYKM